MSNSAHIVQVPPQPWEAHGSIMVECRKCAIEWGWSIDRLGAFDRLKESAAKHDETEHKA